MPNGIITFIFSFGFNIACTSHTTYKSRIWVSDASIDNGVIAKLFDCAGVFKLHNMARWFCAFGNYGNIATL